jgi:hypothetical protein
MGRAKSKRMDDLYRSINFERHNRSTYYLPQTHPDMPNLQFLQKSNADSDRRSLLSVKTNCRINVSYDTALRSQLVQIVKTCAICGYNNIDALEVHHLDHNHSNNEWSNISVICANCHRLIHKGKLDYWEKLNQENLET